MAVDLTKLEKKFIDLFANVTQEEFEQWLLAKTKPMAQQTAVEWFAKQVEENLGWYPVDIIKEAKQMEREQHGKTWLDSTTQFANDARMDSPINFDDYYNKTYKNK